MKVIPFMWNVVLVCMCSVCINAYADSSIDDKYEINENFNGTILDSRWKLPEELKIDTDDNSLQGIADLSTQTVTLELPNAVTAPDIVIETRIKYHKECMGMDLSVNDSDNRQRGYLSFATEGRLMGTNADQTSMRNIVERTDEYNIQDGEWHSIRIFINIETDEMSIFVDQKLYDWDTAYYGEDIKYIKFRFNGLSAAPFALDYFKLYKADAAEINESFEAKPDTSCWNGVEGDISVSNGMLSAKPTAANGDIVLMLPSVLDSGIVTLETRIKYDGNNQGMDLSLNDSNNKQRAYLSFTATSRIVGTNAEQNAMSDIIAKPQSTDDFNIQNGQWHTVKLVIDLDTDHIQICVDGKLRAWDSAYLGDDIKYVRMNFKKNSTSSFDMDYFKIMNLPESEMNAPTVSDLKIYSTGDTIEAKYDFYDADGDDEGEHIFNWYSSDSENGEYKLIPNVNGAVLTEAIQENRYIKLAMTPVDSSEVKGNRIESKPIKWVWNVTEYKEDHFEGAAFSGWWKNTDGVSVLDGMLHATAQQRHLLWINAFAWIPQTEGNYIVEFKTRQSGGTEGFNLNIKDNAGNIGTQMGVLYSEKLYLTKNETDGADVMAQFGDRFDNDEWHTFRYFVNPKTHKTAMMVDGEQIDWDVRYYANNFYIMEFQFKDSTTIDIDDLKIYSVAAAEPEYPSNVHIKGVCDVGNRLTGAFDGKDDGSSVRWVVSDSENGEYTEWCNGEYLDVDSKLSDKYIRFEVTTSKGDVLRSDYVRCIFFTNHSVTSNVTEAEASVNVSNHSGETKNVTLIIAEYNSDGQFLGDFVYKTVTIENDADNQSVKTPVLQRKRSDTVLRSFVWTDFKNIKPYVDFIEK